MYFLCQCSEEEEQRNGNREGVSVSEWVSEWGREGGEGRKTLKMNVREPHKPTKMDNGAFKREKSTQHTCTCTCIFLQRHVTDMINVLLALVGDGQSFYLQQKNRQCSDCLQQAYNWTKKPLFSCMPVENSQSIARTLQTKKTVCPSPTKTKKPLLQHTCMLDSSQLLHKQTAL